MPSSVSKIVLGFVTGALAVLIFHQVMYALLVSGGIIISPPRSPAPPFAR